MTTTNKYQYHYLFIFYLLLILNCSNQQSIETLESDIRSILETESGDFAVAFKDLSTGTELLINEKEMFHAASTMKTPVLIELYKQADLGNLSLEDSLLVHNEFVSIVDSSTFSLKKEVDSEKELYNLVGKKRSLYDLAYDMIIASSNLATNILIDLLDARKITQTMRDLGTPYIQVLRGVEDIKAYEKGLSNTTTAYDLLVIYEKIASDEAVNRESCQEMIGILLDQKFNDIIPAHLPENVKVAHKTGSITGVHHDSGIVFLPDGRKYILVLLSKNLEDFERGTKTLAAVSEKIYQYMIK